MRFCQNSWFKAKASSLRGASSRNPSTTRETKYLRELLEVLLNWWGPLTAALKCSTKAANDQSLSQRSEMRNYWAKCGRILQNTWVLRIDHQRCSIKKSGLTSFVILTGKHLCWSLFLVKSLFYLKRYSKAGGYLWILQIF